MPQEPMVPALPTSTANGAAPTKRKAADDLPALGNAAKKKKVAKQLTKKCNTIRGEEKKGGLVIVRGQPPRSSSTSTQTPRTNGHPASSSSSQPHQEPSLARDAEPRTRKEPVTPKRTVKDTLQPIVEQETPQITKNKIMRGEHPSMRQSTSPVPVPRSATASPLGSATSSGTPGSRRRSSAGLRGKRVSACFENSGTPFADSALYKHIDADLPESHRMRQLLTWSAGRAVVEDSSNPVSPHRARPSSSRDQSKSSLPPLPPGGLDLLRRIQEDVVKELAGGKIDTSGLTLFDDPDPPGKSKENDQNVKNRVREKLFLQQIEDRRAEEMAWAEVSQFYNTYQSNTLASLDNRRRGQTPNSKGKQRAPSQDIEDREPIEIDLPDKFRGSKGFGTARQLLSQNSSTIGQGDQRYFDLQYKEDRIHAAISCVSQYARITSRELESRFAQLSHALSQRSQITTIQPSSASDPSSVSNYLPIQPPSEPSAHSPPPLSDPQDLLRALSRTDAVRPRREVSEVVMRAAKDVQRVQESGGDVGRKLTDVPPPTPRKPPGTPKRPSTPATNRKR